jgi:hypothetical protein
MAVWPKLTCCFCIFKAGDRPFAEKESKHARDTATTHYVSCLLGSADDAGDQLLGDPIALSNVAEEIVTADGCSTQPISSLIYFYLFIYLFLLVTCYL